MVMLLSATFTGIAAISCSSDEFYGFEEGFDNNKAITYGFVSDTLSFLDISSTDTRRMSEYDYDAIYLATKRIEQILNRSIQLDSIKNYVYLNMSDSIFAFALNTIKNTKTFYQSFNNKKRNKNNNREEGFSISGKDCVGQAIAFHFNKDVDSINAILSSHFANYVSNGVPYALLEDAFGYCDINSTVQTNIGSGGKTILIIKPVGSDYHAMNMLNAGYDFDESCYYIQARDKNNSSVFFKLNGSSLPRSTLSHPGIAIDKFYVVSLKDKNP